MLLSNRWKRFKSIYRQMDYMKNGPGQVLFAIHMTFEQIYSLRKKIFNSAIESDMLSDEDLDYIESYTPTPMITFGSKEKEFLGIYLKTSEDLILSSLFKDGSTDTLEIGWSIPNRTTESLYHRSLWKYLLTGYQYGITHKDVLLNHSDLVDFLAITKYLYENSKEGVYTL